MKRRAVFRPEAEAELCEARDWYEAHSSGLGAVFVREIERAIAALRDTLLPKLLSGETRVKDAARVVSGAT